MIKTCPNCKGKGQFLFGICRICNGQGVIVKKPKENLKMEIGLKIILIALIVCAATYFLGCTPEVKDKKHFTHKIVS